MGTRNCGRVVEASALEKLAECKNELEKATREVKEFLKKGKNHFKGPIAVNDEI